MYYISGFMNISVRDVDPKVFREFKVKTVSEGKKAGTALTQAMKEWVEKKEKKEKKKKSLFDLKSWDWGKENHDLSTRVDEILYCGKK